MNRRAMGRGTLFVGEREFVNVEYYVTTVGYESATIGLITLTPDESKDLLLLIYEPAILHLSDGRQANVDLKAFRFLHVEHTLPVDFVVKVDTLLEP